MVKTIERFSKEKELIEDLVASKPVDGCSELLELFAQADAEWWAEMFLVVVVVLPYNKPYAIKEEVEIDPMISDYAEFLITQEPHLRAEVIQRIVNEGEPYLTTIIKHTSLNEFI